MSVYLSVCVCSCICICVCVHIYIHIYIYIYIYILYIIYKAIPSLVEPGTPPEVLAQQDRVRHVESLVLAHPIFARDDRKELLKVRTL